MAKQGVRAGPPKAVQSELVKSIIRKHHRTPISFYKLKDMSLDIVYNPNFLDAVLLLMGFIAVNMASPFYPALLMIPLLIIIFVMTLRHPFLGLVVFIALMFPAIMFEVPALAWIFMFVISMSLIFGYMHYRTLAFAYILVPLAFSPMGYFFEIPVFIAAILVIGYKRAAILAGMLVLAIVMVSGVTGVQNTGYITYNPKPVHLMVMNSTAAPYLSPSMHPLTLMNFLPGFATALSTFVSQGPINALPQTFNYMLAALTFQPLLYLVELAGLVGIAFVIDMLAVTLRSSFKGVRSSLVGVGYPILYILISFISKSDFSLIMPLVSFAIAPCTLYILELYNVNIVQALAVKKQDIRMKFGEAFEDLQSENFSGTFAEIGNYERQKRSCTTP